MILSVRLPEFSLYLERSGKVGDTVLLMRCLYQYWFNKGYWGTISASLVSFLNALAVLIIVALFTMKFEWHDAMTCGGEGQERCDSLRLMGSLHSPYLFVRGFFGGLLGWLVCCSALVSAAYEASLLAAHSRVFNEVNEMARAAGIDTGFLTPYHRWQDQRRRLAVMEGEHGLDGGEPVGSTTNALTLVSWGDFLETMCDYLEREGKVKGCDGGIHLDALLAVQALMQRDNFVTALYDSEMLESGSLRYMSVETIRFLVSSCIDASGTVSTREESVLRLRERVSKYAMVSVALYPFVATFSVLKLLVKNAGQLKSDFREFSRRDWNDTARWRFRLYNEVSFLQDSRLAKGRDIAVAMSERLAVSNSFRHLIRRISSACVLVTMVLTLLNPTLLVQGHIGGMSLVWWLTVALLTFSAFSVADPREREYVYLGDLRSLVDQIHYSHTEWSTSGDAFCSHITRYFLKARAVLILVELLENLAAPFVLLRSLQDGSLNRLITFMEMRSAIVEGVGSVPVDAIFESTAADADNKLNLQEPSAAARSALVQSSHDDLCTTDGTWGRTRTRREKMQQSIASFCAAYPKWLRDHLDADRAKGDASSTELYGFIHQLSNRVQRRLLSSGPLVGENVLQSSAWGGSVLLESVEHAWAPPFTARGRDPPLARSVADSTIENDIGSCVPFCDAEWSTTHARERLFVSQVYSASGHEPTRREAAYGTTPNPRGGHRAGYRQV